ncbi:MAG: hypothetical protein L6Q53_17645, partial [Candidatus Brocadia sinica]|nr:hypothetical protein [Candidatus Brocadia sinica]
MISKLIGIHGYKTISSRDLIDDRFIPIISAVWVFKVNVNLSGCLTPNEVVVGAFNNVCAS